VEDVVVAAAEDAADLGLVHPVLLERLDVGRVLGELGGGQPELVEEHPPRARATR
jgi:hypothetical protein